MMATRATAEQFEACGLTDVGDQLRLASLVSTEVTNCDRVVVDKTRSKPSKAALKQLSELNQ